MIWALVAVVWSVLAAVAAVLIGKGIRLGDPGEEYRP